MSGMKACIRCGRKIDGQARICPYCNWDQTLPVPAQHAAGAPPVEPYVPPPEHRWRKPVLAGIGILAVVLVTGLAIAQRLRDTGPQAVPPSEQQVEQMKLQQKEAAAGPARPTQRANVTLVPDDSPAPSIDQQPITSAPTTTTAQGLDNALQRTDATAVSSSQYSQMAQAAQNEKKNTNVLVDPRSLGGAAYEQGATAPARSHQTAGESATASVPRPASRTAPVPEYQPVPDLSVPENATARLELSIGADGRVRNVDVRQAIPANMGQLVSSVQSWRFRPATENGVPVPSSFTVELSFHARE